jgi:hypothetical protein
MPRWFTKSDPVASVTGVVRAATEEPEPDTLPALERHLGAAIGEINAASGELPGEGVVLARRVTDLAGEALRRSSDDGMNIHARVALHAVLTDYLPTTVRGYVAARRAAGGSGAGGSGTGPTERAELDRQLVEQLTTLHDTVRESVAALRDDDVRALEVQGIFLRDKFTGADL